MKKPGRARKLVLWAASPVLAAGIAVGGYCGGLQLTGNFHTVVPGQFYRSAQPSAADIAADTKQYHIRSILNLRGPAPQQDWYRAEVKESGALGIDHLDFRMSDHRILSRAEAERLVELMRRAPKPLLVHCKAGADRAGLASALYLAAIMKSGEDAAEEQISLRYGHISLPVSPAYAMDRSFERLEPWLGLEPKQQARK